MILTTIQGVNINHFLSPEYVSFVADGDVDCDGSGGNPDNDPYFQPDTTLHFEGKALNAYQVPFIVVPPIICQKTKGIVLGCLARVHYLRNGNLCWAVVGDIGPKTKIGELSPFCAKLLGMNPSAINGGEDEMLVVYEIFVGIPAIIDGVKYELQPYQP